MKNGLQKDRVQLRVHPLYGCAIYMWWIQADHEGWCIIDKNGIDGFCGTDMSKYYYKDEQEARDYLKATDNFRKSVTEKIIDL